MEAMIGVEQSGESSNSIRLTADNRPFNAIVNAGAIACSGLIHSVEGTGAFDRVRDALSPTTTSGTSRHAAAASPTNGSCSTVIVMASVWSN
jgi:glutaminase